MTDIKGYNRRRITRRDFLRLSGLTGAATILGACAPAATPTEEPKPAATEAVEVETEAVEVGTPLKGTKIKALLNDIAYMNYIATIIPEFEEQTGIEVDYEILAWPVMLEQAEIELSSGSDAYDVMPQVFIKTQRWMRAGWSTPLDDYIAKSGFDIDDFLAATRGAMTHKDVLYGIPWLAESTQTIYRSDVLSEAGLTPPDTFEDLAAVLEATHNPPDFYSYVMRTEPNGVHFPYPIWVQGYGGDIYRNPPDDLTPTLNTPEALEATSNFTDLIMKYSIAGSQSYATPDCQNAMAQGLAGIWIDALGIFGAIQNPETSTVADKVQLAHVPAGPVKRAPQIGCHGFQIPTAAKNKDAAWEFISWATSQDIMMRAALEGGWSANPRESVLISKEYGEKYNVGESKVGELIAEALTLADVRYRTVPEFPEVGNRIGQGIAEIISEQKSVEQAMNDVQKDVEEIMIAGGNVINP
jgi:multiple sugar transport system substrate-binding protein